MMKKYIPDIIAILTFVLLSFFYFFPADVEGRIIFQHDTVAGVGAGQEVQEFKKESGEHSRWTNALFGGMPTYQMSPSYDSTEPLRFIDKCYRLFLPPYVCLTFIMFLGFYILLRTLGVSSWLSLLGGVLWAFSSYFFILIAAGHIWKFITLAYIPPTIAGMVLTYRKKYLLGTFLTALFVALQIHSNHFQMSYYFLFAMLFIAVGYGVSFYKNGAFKHFLKASGLLLIAGILGVCVNISNLYHTYEYSKETMRGKSELTITEKPTEKSTGTGLSREYITQWSYGIGETLTLLIPNYNGGASAPLADNEDAMEKANPRYMTLYSQLTQYFGNQPMTAGPVYVGAFVLFLFIFGAFVVKGPLKWALLFTTLFSILLAWGRNFMGLTDLFIDYVPLYNKFRAVSSILVLAEFAIPLLAILGLKELIQKPHLFLFKAENRKSLIISFLLTGGVALLVALFPGLFFTDYSSAAELASLKNAIPAEQLGEILNNINEMRRAIVVSDAWRSFIIVMLGCAILYLYSQKKIKSIYCIAALFVLCLVDMWGVNKRYLNDELFVEKSHKENTFKLTPTDKLILSDDDLNYRVLNFASNTFNENRTSYWHKSVGGYHAAKLRRYQELIDFYISPEMQQTYKAVYEAKGDIQQVDSTLYPIINMLNTKYFIFPAGERGETVPIENPYAFGNAWFIKNIHFVDTADEEIIQLGKIDPHHTAVINTQFKDKLKYLDLEADDGSSIQLTDYAPNRLVYNVSATHDVLIAFSEVYYPGWRAFVDGEEAPIFRLNYILRGMNISKGEHQVEFVFKPKSLMITEMLANAAFVLILLLLINWAWRERKKVMSPDN